MMINIPDLFPLVITNDDDKKNIEETLNGYLQHPDLYIIIFLAPYISEYFIDLIAKSNARIIIALINHTIPTYTKEAIKKLMSLDSNVIKQFISTQKNSNITQLLTSEAKVSLSLNRIVYVKKIYKLNTTKKQKSFVHMKLCFPYFYNKNTQLLYPKCVISGSVNWTKNGIKNNDELLIILRDQHSINKCVAIIEKYWKHSVLLQQLKQQFENK